jgi:hypothetical protein
MPGAENRLICAWHGANAQARRAVRIRRYAQIATNWLQLAGLHSVTVTAADGHAALRQPSRTGGSDRQVEYENMTLLVGPGCTQVAREVHGSCDQQAPASPRLRNLIASALFLDQPDRPCHSLAGVNHPGPTRQGSGLSVRRCPMCPQRPRSGSAAARRPHPPSTLIAITIPALHARGSPGALLTRAKRSQRSAPSGVKRSLNTPEVSPPAHACEGSA